MTRRGGAAGPVKSAPRAAGFRALADRLGPADAIRCLRQFDLGESDYSAARDRLLDHLSMGDIVRGIEEMRGRDQADAADS